MDGYHLGYQLHGTHRLSAAVAAVGTAAVGARRRAMRRTRRGGARVLRAACVRVCVGAGEEGAAGPPETASEAGCVSGTCVRGGVELSGSRLGERTGKVREA